MCLSDPFQALVCVVGLTVARCAVAVTQLFAEEGQGRKFGRYPFRGIQNPLPDWSPKSRQARRSYLFHAGDPLHSSGHPHGALRRTSLACASEASPKVPADRLGSGTGSPRFQTSSQNATAVSAASAASAKGGCASSQLDHGLNFYGIQGGCASSRLISEFSDCKV